MDALRESYFLTLQLSNSFMLWHLQFTTRAPSSLNNITKKNIFRQKNANISGTSEIIFKNSTVIAHSFRNFINGTKLKSE